MGGHDPGRPPARRVERQEGGCPARVPAEVVEGRGFGGHHPTLLSLPVRFAYRSARPKAHNPAGMSTMPITIRGTMS